jgi:cation:H+ antiporter
MSTILLATFVGLERAAIPAAIRDRGPSGAVLQPQLRASAGVMLAEGVHRVITNLGVSQNLLGNTAIAGAVELEEVGRVTVPARHERGDIALGNVFATIVHFAAFNAGVIALVRPLHFDPVTRHFYLPVAAGSVLILVALVVWRRGLGRLEGLSLLALYAAYVAAAITLST